MKLFKRIALLIIALITVLVLAACQSAGDTPDDTDGKQDDKNNKNENGTAVVLSDPIKAAMEANNRLTGSSYFLAEDGTVLTLGGDSEKKQAGEYAKIPNVKKIIQGAGLSAFALTDSGELYYENKRIAENISMAAYCTTNVNVEGFCVINNELKRLNSYEQIDDNALNYMFKNYPFEEKLLGDIVFIEVDKHDFIVLNSEGKFFAYWSSEAYNELDFTGFEELAIVDIAKHMGSMGSGVESLTVAGIKGDGTVVATGTYASDILSWGKLADIAMSDGMIVGLTEDGKVKMTGDFAEKMKETVEGWTDIVAIEAGYATGNNIDNIVTALDSEGVFHFATIMNEYSGIESGSISVNGVTGGRSCHKYTADGKEFYTDYEGNWVENTDE